MPIHEDIKETDIVSSIEESATKFLFDVEWVRSSLDYLESEKIETIIFVLSTFELKENKRIHKKVSSYKKMLLIGINTQKQLNETIMILGMNAIFWNNLSFLKKFQVSNYLDCIEY